MPPGEPGRRAKFQMRNPGVGEVTPQRPVINTRFYFDKAILVQGRYEKVK